MKILEARNGLLTNFEVLQFLQSKGARQDHTRIAEVPPSELKVYDYLERTAASSQTKESIEEFVGKCKKYHLKKAEIVSIINVRPSSVVEIYPMIAKCDERLGEGVEELVEMVGEVLPSPPTKLESNDGNGDNEDENPDEQLEETS
ncbi:uncharacterized protein LOC132283547 [Cornus florida]|uniref:uncharacterized protein LOC132283547 n=1 Tax=Cornus florida TaxID=4283 RepID=UPI002896C9D8|nr:uncharacterized protein LOC132283547 [Cornus florida]